MVFVLRCNPLGLLGDVTLRKQLLTGQFNVHSERLWSDLNTTTKNSERSRPTRLHVGAHLSELPCDPRVPRAWGFAACLAHALRATQRAVVASALHTACLHDAGAGKWANLACEQSSQIHSVREPKVKERGHSGGGGGWGSIAQPHNM